jgi:hypothetical protein
LRHKKPNGQAKRDYTARNKHHLTPRSRGGDESDENLFLLRLDRHFYWHKLFGNKTLEEVISILHRIHRAKGRCLYAKARRPAQCRMLNAGGCHQIKCPNRNGEKLLRVYGSARSGNGKKLLGRQGP